MSNLLTESRQGACRLMNESVYKPQNAEPPPSVTRDAAQDYSVDRRGVAALRY